MIGTSFGDWIAIRVSVIIFRYTPLLYAAGLSTLCLLYGGSAHSLVATQALCCLLGAEALFFGFIYLPYTRRLDRKADHPTPLSSKERWALFNQCMANIQSMELYLKLWFLGARLEDIRRDNLREFLLWGFFDRGDEALHETNDSEIAQDLAGFVAQVEQRLGRKLHDGRGSAKCIRLTLDAIHTTYRSLAWYVVIFIVDQAAHVALLWHGFEFHARQPAEALATIPPRPQELFTKRRSQASRLSYWHRPHRSNDRLPLVFLHGIGVGLWTYVRFLADINAAQRNDQGGGGIGVIAIEILPISFRLTSPPLDKAEFLRQLARILDYHEWDRFAVASHSYGSVLTTHMLHCPTLRNRVAAAVLIDPVTIMLHLPDVAYNFTRRQPKRPNEWQLWYFASTDPGVAHCLGRHFFWRENIIWKEDLLSYHGDEPRGQRRAAVCLAGRDILVDTSSVSQYLAGHRAAGSSGIGGDQSIGIEVLMFPKLDHAQVFDSPPECQRVVRLIRSYCST